MQLNQHPINPYSPPTLTVVANNHPETIRNDGSVTISCEPERLIIEGGLQPFTAIVKSGVIVVQSQLPEHPVPTTRQSLPWGLGTAISRDGGDTWSGLARPFDSNGVNLQGGALLLKNGFTIALDSYVVPGKNCNEGVGELYETDGDWSQLSGPKRATFELPGVDFHSSKDDRGRAHVAARLHRRILELPNGDLLTTLYGWFRGDDESAAYMPTMKRSRVVLLRSKDRGRRWQMVSTVAVGRNVGTEGYNEPVLVRLNFGPHAGRLICKMRTGREQRETMSDDEGRSWTEPKPCVYANLDVYATENWVDMFRGVLGPHGQPIEQDPNELIGAVVDPDVLELRSGVLVSSFGLRIPPRACWPIAGHPWNGIYLAISRDHGASWSHVVRMASGVLTTHYTAICETTVDNQVLFAYDLGDWRSGKGRSTFGRKVTIAVKH